METEHTETVVEKAVAYVKDMFGAPPYHGHVDADGRPIMPILGPEPVLTSDDAMRLDPPAPAFKSVAQFNADVDSENEKGQSYKSTTRIKNAADRMSDDKKLPDDSELEKVVERAKASGDAKDEPEPPERLPDLIAPGL